MLPLVVEFAPRCPGISFEFDLTPRRIDLVTKPFDVAIRTGVPPNSSLVARQLAEIPQALYASPRYLERAGEPRQPADLAQHECLRFHGLKADTPTLHRGGESTEITVMGRFRVNSMGMLERLARHEQGVAVLAGPLVAEAVAAGQLQRVLPQ